MSPADIVVPPIPKRPWLGRDSKVLQNVFWFLVLVSWLPILVGFATIIDFILPWTRDKSSLPTLASGNPIAFALIGAAIALLAIAQRRPVLLVCAIAPALAAFVQPGAGGLDVGYGAILSYFGYVEAFVASLAVYAFNARMRSPHFIVFCLTLLMLFGLDLWMPEIVTVILTPLLASFSISIFDIMLFIGIALLARFIALAILDNKGSVAVLAQPSSAGAALKAAFLWCPLLVLYFVFGIIYADIGRRLERVGVDILLENIEPDAVVRADISLEDALNRFSDNAAAVVQAETSAKVLEAQTNGQIGIEVAMSDVSPTMHAAFPSRMPGTNTGSCSWYDVMCHVMNGIKSLTNRAYVGVKDGMLSKMDAELEQLRKTLAEGGQGAAINTIDWSNAKITEVNLLTKEAVAKVFRAFRNLAFFLAIYTFIMLVKSYLFTLARVLFRANGPMSGAVEDGVPEATRTRAKSVGERYTFDLSGDRKYYVSPRFRLLNIPPQTRVPAPFMAVLPRIISRTYFMNLVEKRGDVEPEVSVGVPREIVVWKLIAGEHILFSFKDLVGFSKGLEIDTVISLRLANMIFGQIFFRRATGPGVLLLRTRGESIVEDTNSSLPAVGLMAWNAKSNFQVDANYTMWDATFSGYNIQKQPGGHLVYDKSNEDNQKVQAGLIRFVKYFILPI